MSDNSGLAYGFVSRFNHWIIALAIIGMLAFGIYIEDFVPDGPQQGALLQTHKAIGVLVLAYGLWRVGWRLIKGFLAPAAPMPYWQDVISKVTHWVLIAGILVMPISGMMTSLFGGHDINVFGLFTIPGQTKIEWLSEFAEEVHGAAANIMIAFIVLHVLGALKHHVIDRDATLVRMTSGKSAR
ncbi:cytochrome b [Hoeflea sp. TYP-13]|uniref:cytochrome b n=1 Tax=Hoeflea sp. TYP-13 TaxID=3230023 RepID=UPI0034C645F7